MLRSIGQLLRLVEWYEASVFRLATPLSPVAFVRHGDFVKDFFKVNRTNIKRVMISSVVSVSSVHLELDVTLASTDVRIDTTTQCGLG